MKMGRDYSWVVGHLTNLWDPEAEFSALQTSDFLKKKANVNKIETLVFIKIKSFEECGDSLVGKDIRCHAWKREFNHQDLHGAREDVKINNHIGCAVSAIVRRLHTSSNV